MGGPGREIPALSVSLWSVAKSQAEARMACFSFVEGW